MSGREHEPVSAFFPSIDRNLMLDLDRHLRGAQTIPVPSVPATMEPITTPARSGLRPDVAHVVEAVEQAAHSISAMTARIDELENHVANVESSNSKLSEKLSSSQRHVLDLEARLKAESERAARIEAVAAQQAGRAAALDRELNAAHGDLARITDAIGATLGFPHRG